MDCRRRSAVDDDRSRRWVVDNDRYPRKWVVDEDRRRIRWAADEDPRRRRWAVDDDRRRRRWAVDDEEDDYPPLQLPLQWRDPPPHFPHEEERHQRRRAADQDRRHEALRAEQVNASLDRIDALFANFSRSLERVCTSINKLSSDIYSSIYASRDSASTPSRNLASSRDHTLDSDSSSHLEPVEESFDPQSILEQNLAILTGEDGQDDCDLELNKATITATVDSTSAQLVELLLADDLTRTNVQLTSLTQLQLLPPFAPVPTAQAETQLGTDFDCTVDPMECSQSDFIQETESNSAEEDHKDDPNLKRLEKVVQKLDKVPAEVSILLHLLERAKQEQQHESYKAHETGFLPRNDLIGRGKDKGFVMQWLRKPSKEHPGTDLYRNISLLSIVGNGGTGKTTLLQLFYEDEIIEEFHLKMIMKDARQPFDGMPDRNVDDKLLERLKAVPGDDFLCMEAHISLVVAGIACAVVAALTASVICSDPHRLEVPFLRNNSDENGLTTGEGFLSEVRVHLASRTALQMKLWNQPVAGWKGFVPIFNNVLNPHGAMLMTRENYFLLKQYYIIDKHQRDIQLLRHDLQVARAGIEFIQLNYLEKISVIGKQMHHLINAASSYFTVFAENKKLYNRLRDLKGSIWMSCRVRSFLPGQMNSSLVGMYRRHKIFDPGGLLMCPTTISLPMTRLDGVKLF